MPVEVAFLDVSVLYLAPLRDLPLELAVSDLYRAKVAEFVARTASLSSPGTKGERTP